MPIVTPGIHGFFIAALLVVIISFGHGTTDYIPSDSSSAHSSVPAASLIFEPNRGQLGSAARYLLRTAQWLLQLEPTSVVMTLVTPHRQTIDDKRLLETPVRMLFDSSTFTGAVVGEDLQQSHTNYYQGDDPAAWRTQIPNYGRVRYQSLFPGVDLVFYGNEGRIEYDFIVAPYADAGQIRFEITGSKNITLNQQGDLEIVTDQGIILMQAPRAYQAFDTRQNVIESGFILEQGRISFFIGNYNHALPLVIDPVLTSVSYLGGDAEDWTRAVAVDADGNTYVTGKTLSTNFPLSASYAGGSDVFVAKYTPTGELLATTIVGSSTPGFSGEQEQGNALVLAADGDILVAGRAGTGFPTLGNPVYRNCSSIGSGDAFVARFDPNLSLIYSTCFGGSGIDEGFGIAEDDLGRMVLVGAGNSDDLPPETFGVYLGGNTIFRDGFIAVIDPVAGNLIFGSYIAGSGSDEVHSVVASSAGSIVIAGVTNSYSLAGIQEQTHGQSDVFVIKYNADYSQAFGRLLGGSTKEGAFAESLGGDWVALDSDAVGNIYIAAKTTSDDIETVGSGVGTVLQGGSDVLIGRLSNQGQTDYLGYFGGSGDEFVGAIAVDRAGERLIIGGSTTSTDLPVIVGIAGQNAYFGNQDAIIAHFDQLMALNYVAYLGGSSSDIATGVALEESGAISVVGKTSSPDLISGSVSTENSLSGGSDAFLVRLAPAIHDLVLSGAGPNGQVATGVVRQSAQIKFQMRLDNFGPDKAQNVVLAVSLPVEVELLAIPAACTANSIQGVSGLNCEFGDLDNGVTRLLEFDVIVLKEDTFTVDISVSGGIGSVERSPLNNEMHVDASPVTPFIIRNGGQESSGGGGGVFSILIGLMLLYLGFFQVSLLHLR